MTIDCTWTLYKNIGFVNIWVNNLHGSNQVYLVGYKKEKPEMIDRRTHSKKQAQEMAEDLSLALIKRGLETSMSSSQKNQLIRRVKNRD